VDRSELAGARAPVPLGTSVDALCLLSMLAQNSQHQHPWAFAMESFNLKTASTYINNLLLARGLLRDGKPIEFAHPSRGEGGKEYTMGQIINLVHDLILKRDVCSLSLLRKLWSRY
jgi:hypothetical protein